MSGPAYARPAEAEPYPEPDDAECPRCGLLASHNEGDGQVRPRAALHLLPARLGEAGVTTGERIVEAVVDKLLGRKGVGGELAIVKHDYPARTPSG